MYVTRMPRRLYMRLYEHIYANLESHAVESLRANIHKGMSMTMAVNGSRGWERSDNPGKKILQGASCANEVVDSQCPVAEFENF